MARSATFAGQGSSLAARLTPTQRRALQNTWKHMSHNGGIAIMERIFQKLINSRPRVKDVFYKAAFVQMFSRYGRAESITTLHDHGRILAGLLSEILADLGNSAPLMAQITAMGRSHAFLKKSGLRAEIWESFGEAALEILAGQDCVKSSVDAVKGWTILVACLVDELRSGFEDGCREADKQAKAARKANAAVLQRAATCPQPGPIRQSSLVSTSQSAYRVQPSQTNAAHPSTSHANVSSATFARPKDLPTRKPMDPRPIPPSSQPRTPGSKYSKPRVLSPRTPPITPSATTSANSSSSRPPQHQRRLFTPPNANSHVHQSGKEAEGSGKTGTGCIVKKTTPRQVHVSMARPQTGTGRSRVTSREAVKNHSHRSPSAASTGRKGETDTGGPHSDRSSPPYPSSLNSSSAPPGGPRFEVRPTVRSSVTVQSQSRDLRPYSPANRQRTVNPQVPAK